LVLVLRFTFYAGTEYLSGNRINR